MGVLGHPYRSALLFAVSLASPALAAAQAEETPAPWAVEAPGAAKARFSLGLDLFFERQESLRIVRLERTIRTRDVPSGNEETDIFREDPALLNRKFDVLLELEGVGSELAVALPSVGAPGAFQLFPTLIVQAAWADVQLDFHDRTRAEDSTSYQGQGPLFTTGLDLTSTLCRSCPWFAGASYRFQTLPSLSVDRSPAFAPPGFAVLDDDVRLAREVQEISTRVGYSFPGNRIASYLGVRYRWTDLEVEDDLRYRDPLGRTETSLSSQTDLESEVTQALAGVEAHLGGSFYGRIETGISDEDHGAWMQVVYLPRGRDDESKIDEDAIADQIRQLRDEFVQAFDALPEPVEIMAVEALLRRFEERLLALLPFPKLAAMQDWVRHRFRQARDLLVTRTATPSFEVAHRLPKGAGSNEYSLAANRLVQDTGWTKQLAAARDLVLETFDLMIKRFEEHDIRIDVCVETDPQEYLVDLYIIGDAKKNRENTVESNKRQIYYRGLYAYDVSLDSVLFGYKLDNSYNLLDLMKYDKPWVFCRPRQKKCTAQPEAAEVKCEPLKR